MDIDDTEALDRLRAFVPSPTAVVASGGGYNAYWKLAEPLADLHLAENINRWLVEKLDGDCAATDVSRILRIPGTMFADWKKLERGRVPIMARLSMKLRDWSRIPWLDRFGRDELPKFRCDNQPSNNIADVLFQQNPSS